MFVLLIIAAALLFVAFVGHILLIGLRSRNFELHPEPATPSDAEGGRWVRTQSMVWSTRQD
jgi:hypothetical protein